MLVEVLASRLRSVIGSVISDFRFAFVKDIEILDGILATSEVVDEARIHKKELLLFKVDFEQAYDFVNLGYLDDVMRKIMFLNLWRK